jgi:hypothetical protein
MPCHAPRHTYVGARRHTRTHACPRAHTHTNTHRHTHPHTHTHSHAHTRSHPTRRPPQDVMETTLALDNFRRACDSGRGAVFFSVARGKVGTGGPATSQASRHVHDLACVPPSAFLPACPQWNGLASPTLYPPSMLKRLVRPCNATHRILIVSHCARPHHHPCTPGGGGHRL